MRQKKKQLKNSKEINMQLSVDGPILMGFYLEGPFLTYVIYSNMITEVRKDLQP